MQVCGLMHTVVQSPQWFASVVTSTQLPLHNCWAPGHPHTELVQTRGAAQTAPQPPQSLELLVVSTQVPLHTV